MKKILLINPHRQIIIKVPIFGKMKVEIIKPKQIRGQSIDLLICDDISNKTKESEKK